MVKIGGFVEQLMENLATSPRPVFIKVPDDGSSMPHGSVPSVGLQFDYGAEGDADGVLLRGASAGRPAAKAGIRAGDRIIAILGKPCKNLGTYMAIMGGVKRGETVEFTILRGGQKLKVKIVTEK